MDQEPPQYRSDPDWLTTTWRLVRLPLGAVLLLVVLCAAWMVYVAVRVGS